MNARWQRFAACVMYCCALASTGATVAGAAESTPLPDWSGWWGLPGPMTAEFSKTPPPMAPEQLARFQGTSPAMDADPDPLRYCRPPQFTGYSGGFVDSVELLFTPGRVTLTNESGLLRRIYTDGRSLPQDVDPKNTGVSVGRWEGQTLVVETVGINPNARYPGAIQGAVPIGKNVMITERISLKEKNTLEFDIITVAPDIFRAPDRRKRVYTRLPKQTASEITFCTEQDRSIDPITGKQRFDMTPPADLPPPPSR
jgi:hypothetical protein